ncbi:DNA cytosine methyltransferase [bacterium endosymbiont of Bathymodiolus sp. 5 South]|jgi:DNA (cytosine-5)-methyltransferase 1|uniref:DNA cytosine methyltransferase n=1 Tax=bacterium endosymbiont of Bathymodiolus sp. 5 South TaxID=1181670 RepID=UPI0010B4AF9C|nr:DNA (cytosine-5-)-methyltransferase [bacterium endosymbiont of Bathymodiolus sp. 5 South]SSC08358.1 DNA-cytosine methyltransferase [bacterium endosymbiont of Bathymodiolus sp. 5 South]VVH63819.1 DNA-cytosine methyltransferase (EC [uncultured Gammaproteobacteria bacterium]
MKFIDLFAGLGGFHVALEKLGHECVFASEIKDNLRNLYEKNFGIKPAGDIKAIDIIKDVPEHDILCAGFPCQPFSKAGNQQGLKDKKNGNLFDSIVEVLENKKPTYFILENVRNLISHNNAETYLHIENKLKGLGYEVDKKIYSPHHIGIPQHRERLFIVGSRNSLTNFYWPEKSDKDTNINDFLGKTKSSKKIEDKKIKVIQLWQDFLDSIDGEELPCAPIWSMEFGATYPFEDKTPYATINLCEYKGSFGKPLKGIDKGEQLKHLPRYARKEEGEFPEWKKKYIRNNRNFYKKHKKTLSSIVEKISRLPSESLQKFEWNIKEIKTDRNINQYLIQFRGSGVRVKKTNFFPSLVTVGAQIPIIGKEMRYLTREEGARLQSMEDIELPQDLSVCFSALGNAVNVNIVSIIAKNLLKGKDER